MFKSFVMFTFISILISCKTNIEAYNIVDMKNYAPNITFSKSEEYLLSGGDIIDLLVTGYPESSGIFRLTEEGDVFLPLIGRVHIAGYSIQKVVEELTILYLKYYQDPKISIRSVQSNSYRVVFLGEINRVSEIVLNKKTTLLEGIIIAGGPARFSTGTIILMRRGAKNKLLRFKTTFVDLLAGKNDSDNIYLDRNDIVYLE